MTTQQEAKPRNYSGYVGSVYFRTPFCVIDA